jgi:outer membrane protein assembly factor BamB
VWTTYLAQGAATSTPPAQTMALHSPIAMDVDGDGMDELLVGGDDGRLYALRSADGSILWSVDLGSPVWRVVGADIDLDPALEILAGLGDGTLVALDATGHYNQDAGGTLVVVESLVG